MSINAKALEVFFATVRKQLQQKPDENDCLEIMQKIERLVEAMNQEDETEAYIFYSWFDGISGKLKFFSPDFNKLAPQIIKKIRHVISRGEEDGLPSLPEKSSFKNVLNQIIAEEKQVAV